MTDQAWCCGDMASYLLSVQKLFPFFKDGGGVLSRLCSRAVAIQQASFGQMAIQTERCFLPLLCLLSGAPFLSPHRTAKGAAICLSITGSFCCFKKGWDMTCLTSKQRRFPQDVWVNLFPTPNNLEKELILLTTNRIAILISLCATLVINIPLSV